jgi:hypothetical protein
MDGAKDATISGNRTLSVLNNIKNTDGGIGLLNVANLGMHANEISDVGGGMGGLAGANGMSSSGGAFDVHVRFGTVDTEQTWTESYLSQFNAGGNVRIGSDKDVNLLGGTQINAGKDIILNAGRDLNIAANEDTYKFRDSSTGVTVGYNGSWYVGADHSRSKSDSTTYTNAGLVAGGNIVTNSGRDTNIAGANLLAGKVLDVNVGRDLYVATLQNSTQSSSYGASVTASYGAGGSGTGASGASISAAQGDRKFADNQTTLIGQQGVRVNVGGTTTLEGSMIANVKPDGTDGGNLILNTGNLITRNLVNTDDSWSFSLGANFAGQDGKRIDGKTGKSTGTLAIATQDVDGVTYATIGHGQIIASGNIDGRELNRDITKTSEIFKNESSKGEVTFTIPDQIAKPAGEQLNKWTIIALNNVAPNPENNWSFLGQAVEWVAGGRELMPDPTRPDIRYSMAEVEANHKLAKGSVRTSTNGIDNDPPEAAGTAIERKGGTDFQLIYNPKHGIIWDLTEVSWNYALGDVLPTAGIDENIRLHQIIKEVNGGNSVVLDPDGHSQGGDETMLAVTHAPKDLFKGAVVQLSGAPVNKQEAKDKLLELTGVEPSIQINRGDFVGKILGGNAEDFGDAAYAIWRFPYLFGDESNHTHYPCSTPSCMNAPVAPMIAGGVKH